MGVPAGTVSFYDTFGGARHLLETVNVDPLSGQAVIVESDLRKRTHTLSVSYTPAVGSDSLTSKSAGIKEVIQAAGPEPRHDSVFAADALELVFTALGEDRLRATLSRWDRF